MASPRICSVKSCDNPVSAKGMCVAHYDRMRRRGTTEPSQTPKGEPLRFLTSQVLPFQGDDCLLWPYNRHSRGYGMIWLDGRPQRVTRIVCEDRHGPPPDGAHAAHSCGVPSCCNPKHLRWATGSENQLDRVAHGTHNRGDRHPNHILSEDDAREIKRLRGMEPQKSLAARFGVSKWQISKIQRGVAWSWLTT